MSLSSSQHKFLHSALLASFDNAGLRQFVRQELDADLDAVAGGQNTTETVTNLLAWADRSGRIADLLSGALRQNPTNPTLQALSEAAKSWHIEAPAPADKPPYKGLAYYDVSDASLFYGRETLTAKLIAYLKNQRFLAVVGASGSGKSSLMRAGVVAQLEKGDMLPGSDSWQVFILTPTSAPLKALATALTKNEESISTATKLMDDLREDSRSLDMYAMRIAAATGAPRVLIVVDQFEELFTECKDTSQRKRFIDNLLTASAPDGSATVVLSLRADFYSHCAEHDNLRMVIQDHQNYIGAMSLEELRTAIERPAVDGDWILEEGLINRLLRDVADQPGSLPLLSHALFETWQRRSNRTLTFQGYEAAGGVQGAIARTAESIYSELSSEEQITARSIFLHLTAPGEDGTPDTKRRASLAELASLSGRDAVLHKLENARLVTAIHDASKVMQIEVAHEALIREWPQLKRWLDENREELRIHSYLVEDAKRWVRLQREEDALYRGSLLLQAQELAANASFQLSPLEQEFIEAGVRYAEKTERALKQLSTNMTSLEGMIDHLSGELREATDKMQSQRTDARTTRDQMEQRLAKIERQISIVKANRFGRLMLAVLLGAVLSIAIWIALLMVK